MSSLPPRPSFLFYFLFFIGNLFSERIFPFSEHLFLSIVFSKPNIFWRTFESTICALLLLSVVEVSSSKSQSLVDTFENCILKQPFRGPCWDFGKKKVVVISRNSFSLLVLPLLFSYLLLIVVRSVIAVTWTSATGHPLYQAVSFHVLSFHLTSFPLFSPLSLFMIMFVCFSFFFSESFSIHFSNSCFPFCFCNLFVFTHFSKTVLVLFLLVCSLL